MPGMASADTPICRCADVPICGFRCNDTSAKHDWHNAAVCSWGELCRSMHEAVCMRVREVALSNTGVESKVYAVQWSEDRIKADPFLGRCRVRFRVPPWVSNTIARDHLAKHRRRPCELRAVV